MLHEEDAVLAEETGRGRFQVRITTGDTGLVADEPVRFGGLGSGPNPFDLLCASLAACTLMTMRMYAERKGWLAPRLRVSVRHRKGAPNMRDVFERVIDLGEGLEEAQRGRLVEIAERCPVHLLLERGAEVTTVVAVDRSPAGPVSGGLHARILEQLCEQAG